MEKHLDVMKESLQLETVLEGLTHFQKYLMK